MSILFLIGRILFGGFFLKMGISHFKNRTAMAGYSASKGVPSPMLAVVGSGALIFLGGLGVILGVYVRLSLIFIILFLIPVTFTMHRYWSVADPDRKMIEAINFNKNIALLGATCMLLMLPLTLWTFSLWP
ncbi:MAG: DoxX family protein [Candidatus Taylorbacteria bacterium]